MKKTLLAAAVAVVSLGGCIAVPVYDAAPGYGYSPGYAPYYAAPAASFSFGYSNRYYGPGYRYRHWRY